jgi:hypothetical protein
MTSLPPHRPPRRDPNVDQIRMLRAALAFALIALAVAVAALCHVLRVLGC